MMTVDQAEAVRGFLLSIDDDARDVVWNALMEQCPHPGYEYGGSMGNVCTICGAMQDADDVRAMTSTYTLRHNDYAGLNDPDEFDDAPNIDAFWTLYCNGEPTGWSLYRLAPESPYYDRGPFGFQHNNAEPQFATLASAHVALAFGYETACLHGCSVEDDRLTQTLDDFASCAEPPEVGA